MKLESELFPINELYYSKGSKHHYKDIGQKLYVSKRQSKFYGFSSINPKLENEFDYDEPENNIVTETLD